MFCAQSDTTGATGANWPFWARSGAFHAAEYAADFRTIYAATMQQPNNRFVFSESVQIWGMARRNRGQSAEQKGRRARATLQRTVRELGAQLLNVLPHSNVEYLNKSSARERWRRLDIGDLIKTRAVWDTASAQVLAFIFDGDRPEPASAIAITPRPRTT